MGSLVKHGDGEMQTEGGKREVIELNCIVGYFTTLYFIVEYANTFIIFL